MTHSRPHLIKILKQTEKSYSPIHNTIRHITELLKNEMQIRQRIQKEEKELVNMLS